MKLAARGAVRAAIEQLAESRVKPVYIQPRIRTLNEARAARVLFYERRAQAQRAEWPA